MHHAIKKEFANENCYTFQERRTLMTSDEAGRLQEAWQVKGKKPCQHSRMVDYLESANEIHSGHLVCRECGEIFPDPLRSIG